MRADAKHQPWHVLLSAMTSLPFPIPFFYLTSDEIGNNYKESVDKLKDIFKH